jgi:hypothetical protein
MLTRSDIQESAKLIVPYFLSSIATEDQGVGFWSHFHFLMILA